MQDEQISRWQQKAKIKLEEMSFYYGEHKVVDDVSMDFFECNVTAIIGPSGCGKSTLIKSINRISEITSEVQVEGRVLLDNKNVYDRDVDLVDLRPKKRGPFHLVPVMRLAISDRLAKVLPS